jgi:hypothetical protein
MSSFAFLLPGCSCHACWFMFEQAALTVQEIEDEYSYW